MEGEKEIMSREIATFQDKARKLNELVIHSFWGGTKDKKCLRFSTGINPIDLTKSNVTVLRDKLNEWLES